MRHVTFATRVVAAIGLATFAMSTAAQSPPPYELSSTSADVVVVPSRPGQASAFELRVTNRTSSPSGALSFRTTALFSEPVGYTLTTTTPGCALSTSFSTVGAFTFRHRNLDVASVAAGATLACSIVVQRQPDARYDYTYRWFALPGTALDLPIGAYIHIGMPTQLRLSTQVVSFSRVGDRYEQVLRVIGTNAGPDDLVLVGFGRCASPDTPPLLITTAFEGGCNRPGQSGQVCPMSGEDWGLGDVPAGGSSSCLMRMSGPATMTLPAYDFALVARTQQTASGQFVWNRVDDDFVSLPFGITVASGSSAAVPGNGRVALLVLVAAMMTLAAMRLRRMRPSRR